MVNDYSSRINWFFLRSIFVFSRDRASFQIAAALRNMYAGSQVNSLVNLNVVLSQTAKKSCACNDRITMRTNVKVNGIVAAGSSKYFNPRSIVSYRESSLKDLSSSLYPFFLLNFYFLYFYIFQLYDYFNIMIICLNLKDFIRIKKIKKNKVNRIVNGRLPWFIPLSNGILKGQLLKKSISQLFHAKFI